jgi:uncharacterized protein (DUF885 family)
VAGFDEWADAFAADWVRANPQLATRVQYFDGAEQDALDRDLALTNTFGMTYGRRAAEQRADLARRGLAELRSFAADTLTPTQQTSLAIIEWNANDAVASAEFAHHGFVFSQLIGFQVSLVSFLTTTHALRNARDAENYVFRLARIPAYLDEGIAEARAAADAGILPPSFIIERTIEQIDGLIAAEENVLLATFVERLRGLPDVTAKTAGALAAAAANEVRDNVLPAFARVRELLAAQRPRATDAAGAWALPNGEAYYARALASATGTSATPEEIHALGLREVARIENEMDAVLRKLGHTDGSVGERVKLVNEGLRYPPEPDPRAAILEHIQAVMDDAAHRARETFNLVPAARVVVRREPAFSEASSAAHYQTPAADGSSPGIYWIPLPNVDAQLPWLGIGLKSTAYHEAIPGHHFQLTLEQESSELPHFRKRAAFGYNPAHNEGWALYSEQLCAESGWYAEDLLGYLGFLQMQLFRARRLVVDTGLHAKRWTRQQAIDYGFPVSEVERYVSWPGQACSYMVGQLHIVALRERAKARLGARFALKGFHDLVLSAGTMPLDVLANVVGGLSCH